MDSSGITEDIKETEEIKIDGSPKEVPPSEIASPSSQTVKTETSIEPGKEDTAQKEEPMEEKSKLKEAADAGLLETPPDHPPDSMQFVKIAKVPKSVMNFMMKEENGDVRLNLTQLKLFMKEMWKMGKHVNSTVWDSCDFPTLDLAVPENAKNHTLVSEFNSLHSAKVFERIETNSVKYEQLNRENYAKMSDEAKRSTWRNLKKTFKIKDNVITVTSPENKPYPPKQNKEKVKQNTPGAKANLPNEIKPAKSFEAVKDKKEQEQKPKNDKKQKLDKNNRKRIMSPKPEQQALSPPKKAFVENSQVPQASKPNQKKNFNKKQQFNEPNKEANSPTHSKNRDRRIDRSKWKKDNKFPPTNNFNNRYIHPTNAPGMGAFTERSFSAPFRSGLFEPPIEHHERAMMDRQRMIPDHPLNQLYDSDPRYNSAGHHEYRTTFNQYSANAAMNISNNPSSYGDFLNQPQSSSYNYYRSHETPGYGRRF